MIARRTDGTRVPGRGDQREPGGRPHPVRRLRRRVPHYTGDELLMLVVRDLTGTVDTEAELARQQRQTEMILRAAAEGVVGVDTEGKVVLVNPSAAQILGFRASDLGGKELHPLVHHSRADGSPLPYEETPLADTLRSGRKHRVRGQVLWRKDGKRGAGRPDDGAGARRRPAGRRGDDVHRPQRGYDALAARARAAARAAGRLAARRRWPNCAASCPGWPPTRPGSCGPRRTRSCTTWPPATRG